MKRWLILAALATASPPSRGAPGPSQAGALSGFPFTDEDLNYSINWPTGSSLGEAHLRAKRSGANWDFTLTLEASVPGFAIKDSYHSETVADYCSIIFDRTSSHGSKAIQERESVDRDRGVATRKTVSKDGGKSDIPVPGCVKDALTYLYYARREMGQGRVPAAQAILFGALHEIRVQYVGAPVISVDGKQEQSDKVTCTVGAGGGDYSFDVYFARDAARTPLLISAPLSMGRFSMELSR
jgi:hypothetical protein